MVWFLERDNDVIACEVRKSMDGVYEYEVTGSNGQTRVQRYENPTPFLDAYLEEQQELLRQGWRPRLIATF